jgi:hypothetical protein
MSAPAAAQNLHHADICKIAELLICRWYHQRGTITDITKIGTQVNNTCIILQNQIPEIDSSITLVSLTIENMQV